eukprot:c28647_g3_i5 orf=1104-3239(+)
MAGNKNGGHATDASSLDLQQKLQAAVQNVQWTYTIFWHLCPQQGVLVWSNGFYNGRIKTRKTVTPEELSPEELCLQRTSQLRELYNMLSASANKNQPASRPCAALSPEDLADTEWFYLLCMSFTFTPGEGLPGQAFSKSKHIWLCEASEADSKLFERALLAKTAQIQTVICIPLPDGVVELGTTEFVHEESGLIKHIRSSFSAKSKRVCSEQSTSCPQKEDRAHQQVEPIVSNEDAESVRCLQLDSQRFEHLGGDASECLQDGNDLMVVEMTKNLWSSSPGDSTNNPGAHLVDQNAPTKQNPYSTLFPVLSLEKGNTLNRFDFSSDEMTNFQGNSGFSHGMVLLGQTPASKTCNSLVDDIYLLQSAENAKMMGMPLLQELPQSDTSTLLERNRRMQDSGALIGSSAFSNWSDYSSRAKKLRPAHQQHMLKSLLFSVTRLQNGGRDQISSSRSKDTDKETIFKTVHDDLGASHVMAERRRREKLNDRFLVLRSMIPFVTKTDKASVLGDAIQYLTQLQHRIQELEEHNRQIEAQARRKEWESQNILLNVHAKKILELQKKKITEGNMTCEGVEYVAPSHEVKGILKEEFVELMSATQTENSKSVQELCNQEPMFRQTADELRVGVTVSPAGDEASIEIVCQGRDNLLLNFLQALKEMDLEIVWVQSSSSDDTFKAAFTAKVQNSEQLAQHAWMEVEDTLRHIAKTATSACRR